jgi:hypothetical protein
MSNAEWDAWLLYILAGVEETASVYLQQLTAIGVLTERGVSKEKLFVHPKLLHLLTIGRNDFDRYALTTTSTYATAS